MKRTSKIFVLLFALLLFLPVAVKAEGTDTTALNYSDKSNWAYLASGTDTGVDIFMLCPTVDNNNEANATLDDTMKKRFLAGLSFEKGVYEDSGRIYSPYYRQMAMAAYAYDAENRAKAMKFAYNDVSAAFRYYLDHENNGRAIVLAGFSQGSQMCLELLKEYYGGDSEEAVKLRKNLVAVYAIGWRLDESTVTKYPWIVPATGEKDFGSVISYDCEDGTLDGTMLIPKGTKALSINPLNWKTDGTVADKSLNLGSYVRKSGQLVQGFCGARIGDRGELIVSDIDIKDFPPTVDGSQSAFFPEGHLHIYDYDLFFSNLKKNVETRIQAWSDANQEPEKAKESEKTTLQENKLKVKNKTVKVKYSKLKKKAQFIKAAKVKKGNSAKTKISYKLVKANKKKKAFTVASSGKIKVKKGTKKGTYKLTIKATAAKTTTYKSAKKNFIVIVKIK